MVTAAEPVAKAGGRRRPPRYLRAPLRRASVSTAPGWGPAGRAGHGVLGRLVPGPGSVAPRPRDEAGAGAPAPRGDTPPPPRVALSAPGLRGSSLCSASGTAGPAHVGGCGRCLVQARSARVVPRTSPPLPSVTLNSSFSSPSLLLSPQRPVMIMEDTIR